jgi:hypothetical protein
MIYGLRRCRASGVAHSASPGEALSRGAGKPHSTQQGQGVLTGTGRPAGWFRLKVFGAWRLRFCIIRKSGTGEGVGGRRWDRHGEARRLETLAISQRRECNVREQRMTLRPILTACGRSRRRPKAYSTRNANHSSAVVEQAFSPAFGPRHDFCHRLLTGWKYPARLIRGQARSFRDGRCIVYSGFPVRKFVARPRIGRTTIFATG